MPGNKYNCSSSHIPLSRTERLLRDRELREKRKSNRARNPNDIAGSSDNSENDLRLEGDSSRQYVEQYLEGAAAAMAHDDACERQEARPYNRQRLLVVANRLPVSAVRRGEDSWSLEISAGGLVSALLGKSELSYSFQFSFFHITGSVSRATFICSSNEQTWKEVFVVHF